MARIMKPQDNHARIMSKGVSEDYPSGAKSPAEPNRISLQGLAKFGSHAKQATFGDIQAVAEKATTASSRLPAKTGKIAVGPIAPRPAPLPSMPADVKAPKGARK